MLDQKNRKYHLEKGKKLYETKTYSCVIMLRNTIYNYF